MLINGVERDINSHANLQYADLQSADLRSADLRYTNLWSADLRSADLQSADLRNADLRFADLRNADLQSADLRNADLRNADLRYTNLWSANLRSASLPSPASLLLCIWGKVSDDLCTLLMQYDAMNHSHPEMFDIWAQGGDCPYNNIPWQRACNFQEERELWKPGNSDTPYNLIMRLFVEKEIKR